MTLEDEDEEGDAEAVGPRDWDTDTDLWENQGQPLTVRRLRLALSQAADDLPLRVVLYDGTANRKELVPMELGFTGVGNEPSAIVLTVHPEQR